MITDASSLARYIQSATAARLDAIPRSERVTGGPEAPPVERIDDREPFVQAGSEAEPEHAGATGRPKAPEESAREGRHDEGRQDDRIDEVRRVLEDREEELRLELKLQQVELEDDPSRLLVKMASLRREALSPQSADVTSYRVAVEASREMSEARRALDEHEKRPQDGHDARRVGSVPGREGREGREREPLANTPIDA